MSELYILRLLTCSRRRHSTRVRLPDIVVWVVDQNGIEDEVVVISTEASRDEDDVLKSGRSVLRAVKNATWERGNRSPDILLNVVPTDEFKVIKILHICDHFKFAIKTRTE
jgi:hypothetical protein